MKMDTHSVTLRGMDGKEVTISLAALSDTSKTKAQAAQQLSLNDTPVFRHENRFLRWAIYPDSTWLKVEFLMGNTVVNNETYEASFQVFEVDGRNWKSVRVKQLHGEIKKGRSDVTMQVRMDDGVVVEFTVDVDQKAELSYCYDVVEIPENLPKIVVRTTFSFPKLLEYDMKSKTYVGVLSENGVPFAELPVFLSGYEINVDGRDSKTKTIPYHEKQDGNTGGRAFTVHNPGKKSFHLAGPKKAEEGNLSMWFYSGKAPFEGFKIRSGESRDGHKAGPFSISIK